MRLRGSIFKKISQGGMPPDPPSCGHAYRARTTHGPSSSITYTILPPLAKIPGWNTDKCK